MTIEIGPPREYGIFTLKFTSTDKIEVIFTRSKIVIAHTTTVSYFNIETDLYILTGIFAYSELADTVPASDKPFIGIIYLCQDETVILPIYFEGYTIDEVTEMVSSTLANLYIAFDAATLVVETIYVS